MALPTVLEKLQVKDEKNILVQGLPSSIEKQFIKLSFAKSVTPLLRSRRIDLALVFAISKTQLTDILKDILPAMHEQAKLWIAYPKPTAKIASDLCRDCNWETMTAMGFETVEMVELDNTWIAMNFKKLEASAQKKSFTVTTTATANGVVASKHTVSIPEELKTVFRKNKNASEFFDSLPIEPKKLDTRSKRVETVLTKLNGSKKSSAAK